MKSSPDSNPADVPELEDVYDAGYQADNVLIIEENGSRKYRLKIFSETILIKNL